LSTHVSVAILRKHAYTSAKKELSMQESILLFFLNIANPVLDVIGNIASLIGEQTIIIAIALYILYNNDKKKGFYIFSSVAIAVMTTNLLKSIVRSPRPFQVIDSIQGKRLATATGYSFPSGHTTTGASFYTALALAYKKRILTILCIILMSLVGLSRLYLGVHWPIDVLVGLIIGISFSLLFSHYLDALYDDEHIRMRFLCIMGVLFVSAALLLGVLLNFFSADEVAYTDLMKALSLGGGGYFGFVLENKKVHFSVNESRGKQILRYVLGLAGIFLIMGTKIIIPDSLYAIGAFLRYTLIGFWATGLFPFIGKSLHLFSDVQ